MLHRFQVHVIADGLDTRGGEIGHDASMDRRARPRIAESRFSRLPCGQLRAR
jgi:hypothetical protein